MAVVQGVKEKVHLPIYDSVNVEAEKQLNDIEKSSTLKFFVDVQGKTKLETNLQSASLLPHYNTFEARAMRVVISDLKPIFPDKPDVDTDDTDVTDSDDDVLGVGMNGTQAVAGKMISPPPNVVLTQVSAVVNLTLKDLIEQLQEADDSSDGTVDIPIDPEDDRITVTVEEATPRDATDDELNALADFGGQITFASSDLKALLDSKDITDVQRPLDEQVHRNNGAGTLIGRFVYNTVTSLYVGEKLMIQMPTWFFPAGGGVWNQSGNEVTHGEPTPLATFRFAEPIYIDKQQNFRVELEIPDSDVFQDFKRIYGPFIVWVVLDGYMTRDVQ